MELSALIATVAFHEKHKNSVSKRLNSELDLLLIPEREIFNNVITFRAITVY